MPSILFRVGSLAPKIAALLLAVGVAPLRGEAAEAHFAVTDTVVQADLQPFTATISRIGNGHRLSGSGGFEPRVVRNRLVATQDAPNRIHADPWQLSHFNQLRSGALDGAEIEVLRIENGKFRSVRRDRVAAGGFHASGWYGMQRTVVAPAQTRFVFAWANRNRSGVPYYFTVRAVDRRGALSPPADTVSAIKPDRIGGDRPENTLIRLQVSDRDSRRLDAPENLQARVTEAGQVELTWDPVPGAAGYVVYNAEMPPEAQRGYYMDLEGTGAPIRAGDMILLRHRIERFNRSELLTNRIWEARFVRAQFGLPLVDTWMDDGVPGEGGWQLIRHDPDTVVEDPGETHLRVTLKQGERLAIGGTNHAGTGQSLKPVLDPRQTYRFEVWARGLSTRPMRFELSGIHHANNPQFGVRPQAFRVSSEWRRYTGTFRVPGASPGTKAGGMFLVLEGPAEIDLDNLRIYREGTPFMAALPEDAARLRASAMGALRTHGLIKTGIDSYDLRELTNSGGATNIKGGLSLPQQLSLMEQVGSAPWLQIEPHFSREEWLGLVEYLAAPFDPARDDPQALPWAAKRVAHGQAAPWTDRFDRILLEIGNETWNRIFHPWTFDAMTDGVTGQTYSAGEVYGLYQEYVLSILRESPHWARLSPRLETVLGGWQRREKFGLGAAARSPGSDYLTVADYIGGWDSGEGAVRPTPEGFGSVLAQLLQVGVPVARTYLAKIAAISAERETPLRMGTYESGPGYVLDGLNRQKLSKEGSALQEEVMKSAAAGTATLDGFLGRALAGYVLQNFFAYDEGMHWKSHAPWHLGGQTYPSWELLALFNREGLGDLLEVTTLAVPTADVPAMGRRPAIANAPMAAAYATRRGDRLALVVVSRRIPGAFGQDEAPVAVAIDLPFSSAGSVTRHRLSGTYESHNRDSAEAALVSETLQVPKTLPRLEIATLPPGMAHIYVFEGVR